MASMTEKEGMSTNNYRMGRQFMLKNPILEELKRKNRALEDNAQENKRLADELELIFNGSPDLIGSGNLDGYFTKINSSFEKILGYSSQEFLEKPFLSFVHEDDVEITKTAIKDAIEGEKELVVENRYRCKDGAYKWIEWRVFSILQDYKFIAVGRHITERKHMEEALRENEKKYRLLLETLNEGVWRIDAQGITSFVNPKMAEMLGYAVEEMVGKHLFLFMDEDWVKVAQDRIEKRKQGLSEQHEFTFVKKDGSKAHTLLNTSPVYNDQGDYDGALAGVVDIKDRKKMEEALQASEMKYRAIIEDQSDLLCRFTPDHRLTFVNQAYARNWGKTQDELIGVNFLAMIPEWVHDKVKKHFKSFSPENSVQLQEHEVYSLSGEIRWQQWSNRAFFDDQGHITEFQSVGRDVTDRKKAEEALQKSEEKIARLKRMESLGLMAGGIAHDLNNILSGIASYPELILYDLPENSPLRRPIETINESGQRAANVVSDLMTIAKGIATNKENLNINKIIRDYLKSPEHGKLEKEFPSIRFDRDLCAELMNIKCSPSHIKKTVMNLCYNGVEAIEREGVITITTSNIYLDEPLEKYEDICIGEYVLLEVADNGTGILKEDLDRIFEPFYTKKIMGRSGTGLGLAVVWNTIQDHEGYVNVKSNDKGSVFQLYFPANRDEEKTKEEQAQFKDYLGNGEKILIVDDEKLQLEIASNMLTKLGYRVEAVSSGENAIGYLQKHSVDLILLDMIMPKGLNGRETFEEIIKLHPKQKAIIASGFAKTEDVEKTQELGAGEYLRKPYTMEKIGMAIKQELMKSVS